MHVRSFRGRRHQGGAAHVYAVDFAGVEHPLPLHLGEGCDHSPDGPEWGYGGSGPAQLAYAILREAGLQSADARLWHQSFKWLTLAHLPPESWELPVSAVFADLARLAQAHEAVSSGPVDLLEGF